MQKILSELFVQFVFNCLFCVLVVTSCEMFNAVSNAVRCVFKCQFESNVISKDLY